MSFSSRRETHDPYPPSVSSSSTSINRVLHHRSSKATIQSHQESISNFSVHTATAAIHKDRVELSEEEGSFPSVSHHSSNSSSGRVPSNFDHKSFQKPTFESQNQSLSTVCAIQEPKSDHSSTPTFGPSQKFRSLNVSSLEDEAESSLPSTSRSSLAISPTLITGPSQSPVYAITPFPPLDDGDVEPSAAIETSTADTSIRPASFFPRLDRMGTSWRSRSGTTNAKGKKRMLGFMTDFLNSNNRPEISTPRDPLHLMHVGFDSSTRKFTGLPGDWQRPFQDSGISKSAQEKNPLSVMEVVKFHQEGGGDVWDGMHGMGHPPQEAPDLHPFQAWHMPPTLGCPKPSPKLSMITISPRVPPSSNDRTLGDQRSGPALSGATSVFFFLSAI